MKALTILMLFGLAILSTSIPITFHYKNSSKIPSNYEFQIKHGESEDNKENYAKCKTVIYVVSDDNNTPHVHHENERYAENNIKNNDNETKNNNLSTLDYISLPKQFFGNKQSSYYKPIDTTGHPHDRRIWMETELRKKNKNTLRDRIQSVNGLNKYRYVTKLSKDEEFIDNTDPRNDKGDWEDGELDQKYASTTYRYNIYELSQGNANFKLSQEKKEENLTQQKNYIGDLNDFFVNETLGQENNKSPPNNYTGDLDDFFVDDLKKNKKKTTGDLNDFFDGDENRANTSQRKNSGDLDDFFDAKNENLTIKKKPKEHAGELDDFLGPARDMREEIASKSKDKCVSKLANAGRELV